MFRVGESASSFEPTREDLPVGKFLGKRGGPGFTTSPKSRDITAALNELQRERRRAYRRVAEDWRRGPGWPSSIRDAFGPLRSLSKDRMVSCGEGRGGYRETPGSTRCVDGVRDRGEAGLRARGLTAPDIQRSSATPASPTPAALILPILAALNDAPVRRLRDRQGDQQALPNTHGAG